MTEPTPETPTTITITPDYPYMARFFARAILDDARDERRKDTAAILGSLLDVIVYLARTQPETTGALIDTIKAESTR